MLAEERRLRGRDRPHRDGSLHGVRVGHQLSQVVVIRLAELGLDDNRVTGIEMPVFVANGDSDPMIRPRYSYLLAGLIPQAQLKIYPDSAHGFLFQHHAEFAADVLGFLD